MSLLLRLYGDLPSTCARVSDVPDLDKCVVLTLPGSNLQVTPQLLPDGTAVYTGTLSRGVPFAVLVKRSNHGKRHSHRLFFSYMHCGVVRRTANAILFVDSDVSFAWKGNDGGLRALYERLVAVPSVGGACGEIEVWGWTSSPIVAAQHFEYKSNQFLAKSCESWFGMVTCLPGAFCVVRPRALEHVLGHYLRPAKTVLARNQLDLGEDRTMTTLLLEAGWRTAYVPEARALTEAPATLERLVRQRRRWVNSTVVNMALLLRRVHRPAAAPLLLSLAVELVSSFTLPTAVLLLLYQVGTAAGINHSLVAGAIAAYALLLVILSLAGDLGHEQVAYFFNASAAVGAFAMFLMIIFIAQSFGEFFAQYWLELVVAFGWAAVVVLASVVHRQWTSVLGIAAPLCWLFLSPTLYVIVPIYAVCNFDDVSWGTRG
eukprot:TRINITY_DN911_c0_g1_i10.p1 TRINITY_DN911_c0_g1~~TRINITY_DN911_c0_g1_i10.p1  ORF type:complete len:430 (+),score=95.38 TRINITY_DN911_c0_g1_i10:499-1788(+)